MPLPLPPSRARRPLCWGLVLSCACAASPKERGAAVVLGAVEPCAAPRDAPAWTESAGAVGLSGPAGEDDSDGGGAAVGDIDGDGHLDVVLATDIEEAASLQVFWGGADGRFTEEPLDREAAAAVGLADLDGDGRPELLVGGEDPAVLRWDGAFSVVDELEAVAEEMLRELLPVDLDGDGDLDLFAALTGPEAALSRDTILWNEGGWLRADPAGLGAAAGREAFDAVVLDWDGDTRPDVYVVNDMGARRGPNVLWQNTGGALVDRSEDCDCDLTMDGMGGAVADTNGDGAPDLYLAATSRNVLLESDGAGGYVDTTVARAANSLAEAGEMAWGGVFWEANNDGRPDLAVAQGDFRGDHGAGLGPLPFVVLVQEADGRFSDETAVLGLGGTAWWRAVVPVDLNRDGVQDLLLTRAGAAPALYLSTGCTAAAWLSVAAPVGSRVEVVAGGQTQTAWVATDPGFAASRPAAAWFGLGAAETVDRLRVVLPWSGGVREAGPFAPRRRVVVAP